MPHVFLQTGELSSCKEAFRQIFDFLKKVLIASKSICLRTVRDLLAGTFADVRFSMTLATTMQMQGADTQHIQERQPEKAVQARKTQARVELSVIR